MFLILWCLNYNRLNRCLAPRTASSKAQKRPSHGSIAALWRRPDAVSVAQASAPARGVVAAAQELPGALQPQVQRGVRRGRRGGPDGVRLLGAHRAASASAQVRRLYPGPGRVPAAAGSRGAEGGAACGPRLWRRQGQYRPREGKGALPHWAGALRAHTHTHKICFRVCSYLF